MDKVNNVSSTGYSNGPNWDYIRQLDARINAEAAIGGSLGERFKDSAQYRIQSKAIESGTELLLKDKLSQNLLNESTGELNGFQGFAKTVAQNTSATTYESLVRHIKDGGSVGSFDWAGLLKGRTWNQVDHVTCVADGTAKSLGRALAANFAKAMIVFSAYKSAKISYENSMDAGKSQASSLMSAASAGIKEIGKSMISWEAGSLGVVAAAVFLPGLGFAGAILGGVLLGGSVGYMLEQYSPAPQRVKQPVNPFN